MGRISEGNPGQDLRRILQEMHLALLDPAPLLNISSIPTVPRLLSYHCQVVGTSYNMALWLSYVLPRARHTLQGLPATSLLPPPLPLWIDRDRQ